MHGGEALRAARIEHANQVHHVIGPGNCRRDRWRIAQIRLHQFDLADIAHGAQEQAFVRAPHGHPHPQSPRRQLLHQVATDKAGAAKDGDNAVFHGKPPWSGSPAGGQVINVCSGAL